MTPSLVADPRVQAKDPPAEDPDRIEALDGLRGIAALGIVGHHLLKVLLPELGVSVQARTGLFAAGYLWVDLFFLLSGFVLTHVYGNRFQEGDSRGVSFRGFMKARFARLYPLHLVVLLGFLASEVASFAYGLTATGSGVSAFQPPRRGMGSFFSNLLLAQIFTSSQVTTWNEPSWSISAEWAAYILLPFAVPRLLRLKPWLGLLFGSGLMFIPVMLEKEFGTLDLAGYPGLVRCVSEMWLGVLLYRLYRTDRYSGLWRSGLLAVFSWGLGIWILHGRPNDAWFVPVAGLILLTSAWSSGKVRLGLGSWPLRRLGLISYSIYMTHWFVISTFRNGWALLRDGPFGEGLTGVGIAMLLVAAVTCLLVLSEFTFRAVEVPMRRRIRSIGSGRTGRGRG